MTKVSHSLGQAEKLTIPCAVNQEERLKLMSAINDEHVVEASTLHEQIGWLCSILRPEGVGISYEKIGHLFTPHKSHATIKRHFEAFQKTPKPPKRPELLSKEQYQTLSDRIHATITESGHPSLCNIISFIRDSFQIEVSRPTASRILK